MKNCEQKFYLMIKFHHHENDMVLTFHEKFITIHSHYQLPLLFGTNNQMDGKN